MEKRPSGSPDYQIFFTIFSQRNEGGYNSTMKGTCKEDGKRSGRLASKDRLQGNKNGMRGTKFNASSLTLP
jgi:hypothetical protein